MNKYSSRLRDTYEEWSIHGVIPGDYVIYGDWVVQKDKHLLTTIGSGIIYHNHGGNGNRIFYMVNEEGKCRECGEPAPAGVLFKAKTEILK